MLITCPHCGQYIQILQLNCRIFRCGVYKKNGKQIDPHLNENSCKELKKNNLIYGCGKPFKILEDNTAIVCEYI
jgi:DNA-directed RNA polymerase subunit RPC12/RpoP